LATGFTADTLGEVGEKGYPLSRDAIIPRFGDPRSGGFLTPLTVVVADDHPAVLEAVAGYLQGRGLEVVGRARDGEEAFELVEARRPQVVIADVRMPKLGGIELARRLMAARNDATLILYSGYGERAELLEALDAGIAGFVLKEAPLEDIVRAVETVAGGGTYVDPVLAGALAASAGRHVPELTQRERDVLRLLADGLSNEEIGKRLFISAETVRTHLRKAMDKLGAETRTQAVALALREHLIS
jgi:DNA-binding NarL/FixJ family response regulator